MISKSVTVDLLSKINPEVFKTLNKDVYGSDGERLGSSQGAVNRILTNYEEMLKVLMPTIITTSPNDQSWYKKVNNYWHSFGIKVPIGGCKLEIGFKFSLDDTGRASAIKTLLGAAKAKGVELKTDEQFSEYVLTNVTESEKYKYATPINIEDYLIWTYCLGHREVAKKGAHIEKSTNIRFVLVDPRDLIEARKEQHSIGIDAMKRYLELIADRKLVKDILYSMGENAKEISDLDADFKLKQFADTKPTEFLALVNDKGLAVKARIERYIAAGVLRRLPNTSIVVDSDDSSSIIGNTTDEAVAYFSAEVADKVAKVKELQARYNQINANK